jgi:hypothetical protein
VQGESDSGVAGPSAGGIAAAWEESWSRTLELFQVGRRRIQTTGPVLARHRRRCHPDALLLIAPAAES